MSADRRSPTEWSKRLAETLVGAGRISGDTAADMLTEAAVTGRPVAAVLADRGVVEAAVSLAELARISGVPSVDISEKRPMGEAFRLVPELFAREMTAIGYKLEGERLTLACAEPIDVAQQREISAFLGVEVSGCLLADPVAIEHLMNAVYPRLSSDEKVATAASTPATAGVGATQVTGSVMNVPAQVPEPVMAGSQLYNDVSSNGSPESQYDASDWQADYGVDVRHTTLPAASGGMPDIEPFKPTLNPDGTLDIDELLTYTVRNGASDLHLANQLPPAIRIDGSLRPIEGLQRLDNEQIREMVYRVLTQNLRERFEAERELDTAHTIMGVGRFRVNLFQQRGSIGTVMRAIPHEIPRFDTLGLPPVVPSLAELRRGLVLVTGPTGSGKSTTLASLVNIINLTKPVHIVTIEDPIEFLHTHNRSIVNQREVGSDTKSFAEALRHVLRQDPDVILIGEMRDPETIATALTAAETGHLVFSTLHTQDTPQTIDRIIDVFPSSQQDQIRIQLAGSLEAVITQQLVLSASGYGRVPVAEVMLCNPAIRNLIRSRKTHQIYSLIQTGAAVGMQTMDQALAKAVQAGLITEAMAFDRCHDPSELRDYLGQR
ncbi:MAG: PilT/PilU family type 4a pilus ATPase [Acidimicrobiales bacterium]